MVIKTLIKTHHKVSEIGCAPHLICLYPHQNTLSNSTGMNAHEILRLGLLIVAMTGCDHLQGQWTQVVLPDNTQTEYNVQSFFQYGAIVLSRLLPDCMSPKRLKERGSIKK